MNHRNLDSAEPPTPDAMRADQDRFVRRDTVAPTRRDNGNQRTRPTTSGLDRRPASDITARDQPATIAMPLVQIGISDQVAQLQSP
jgi:hypothetical protein